MVRHFAGAVCYGVVSFCDKNLDQMQKEVVEMLCGVQQGCLSGLFCASEGAQDRRHSHCGPPPGSVNLNPASKGLPPTRVASEATLLAPMPPLPTSIRRCSSDVSSATAPVGDPNGPSVASPRRGSLVAKKPRTHRARSSLVMETVSSQFRQQLADLMETISDTQPHYIR